MIPFVLDKPHSALYAQSGCPTNGCKGYSQFSLDLSPKTWSTWSECGCQVDAQSRTREVCNSLEPKLTKELETEPCYLSRTDSQQITKSRFNLILNWIILELYLNLVNSCSEVLDKGHKCNYAFYNKTLSAASEVFAETKGHGYNRIRLNFDLFLNSSAEVQENTVDWYTILHLGADFMLTSRNPNNRRPLIQHKASNLNVIRTFLATERVVSRRPHSVIKF